MVKERTIVHVNQIQLPNKILQPPPHPVDRNANPNGRPRVHNKTSITICQLAFSVLTTITDYVFHTYDVARTVDSPDDVLLAFLQSTYEAAATRAKWNRNALERKKIL
ncbi:MAG: DUF5996 family protein [Candidatus Nitrosopolaris sp.]